MITQANAHSVVSNKRGSSVCHGDGAMKNKSMVYKGGIGQVRGGINQCKRVHQKSLCVFLKQARHKKVGARSRVEATVRQNSV